MNIAQQELTSMPKTKLSDGFKGGIHKQNTFTTAEFSFD